MPRDPGTGADVDRKRKRQQTFIPTLGSRLAEAVMEQYPATPLPSPDTRDRATAARERNVARGAPASGGPGRAARKRAVKTLDRGSVKEMQAELRREGFHVPTHGRWDEKTRKAWGEYARSLTEGYVADVEQTAEAAPDLAAEAETLGFLGAQDVGRERLATNMETALSLEGLTGTARPGPEPEPETPLLERAGGFAATAADLLTPWDNLGSRLTTETKALLPHMTPENAERFRDWVNLLQNPDDENLQQAGFAPGIAERALTVWGHSAKSAVTSTAVFGDMKEIAWGTAQMLGALASTPGDKAILGEIGRALVLDYRERYGDNWQAHAKEDPLFNLLDMTAAANATTRIAGISNAVRKGATLRDALWDSYNPSRSGKRRTLSRPEAGTSADFHWGRSPVSRFFQRAYDAASGVLPDAVPGSKARRIDRRVARDAQRGRKAKEAQMATLIAQVRKPDRWMRGFNENENARTRLWWESQLPRALRNDAGLIAVRERLVQELSDMELRDGTPTDLTFATLLNERIRELDAAIAYKPTKRYAAALDAMDELSDFVEQTEARAFSYEGYFIDPDVRQEWIGKLKDEIARLQNVRATVAEVVPPATRRKPGKGMTGGPERSMQIKRLGLPGDPATTLAWLDDEITDLSEHLRMLEQKDYGSTAARPRTPEEAEYPISEPRQFPEESYPTYLSYEDAVARTMAKFQNRRSLLAEWVFGEGIGGGAYQVHKRGTPAVNRSGGGSLQTTTGSIIRDADISPLNLTRKNALDLVRTGQVAPDPEHTLMRALKVMSLEMMNDVRGNLWERGRDLAIGEIPAEGDFLVRARGSTRPPEWAVADVQPNAEALRAAVEGYRQEFLQEVGPEARGTLQALGWLDAEGGIAQAGMRVIPRKEVERLFYFLGGKDARRILGEASKAGQVIDLAEGFVKMAILYANPGYYPANLLGNMVFLALHQGPAMVRSLADSARLHADDPQTWNQIASEMGQGAAMAYLQPTTGTGKMEVGLGAQRAVAHAAGFVDRGPRAAAWIHEARRQGYKNPSDWKALLRAHDDPDAQFARAAIRERGEGAMVDFEAMTPFEKNYIRRLIFVYPWIRGSAAWSGHFTAEFPERAALLASTADAAHQVSEENLEGHELPTWLATSFVRGVAGGVADVVNFGTASPLSTLGELSTMARDPRQPVPEHHSFWDMLNPLFQDIVQIAQGEDRYGRNIGYAASIMEALPGDFIPGYSLGEQMANPDKVSEVYADDSPRATLERRALRFTPFEVDLRAAKQAVERENPEPPDDRPDVLQRVEKIEKAYASVGEPLPAGVKIIALRLAAVALAEEKLKEDLNLDRAPTPSQKVAVRIAVIERDKTLDWTPEDIAGVKRDYEAAKGSTEDMKDLLRFLDGELGKNDLDWLSEDANKILDMQRAEREEAARAEGK